MTILNLPNLELRTCPFCGGKNIQVIYLKVTDDLERYIINCEDCDGNISSMGQLFVHTRLLDETVKKWNRRNN